MARKRVSRRVTAHTAKKKAVAKRAKDTHFGKRGAAHVKIVNAPRAW